ncbi:MAG: DUF1080 domain-containing protein [Planctomycetes bacterium]|nr:DUF1080 domain-containing protein [Planctomycetota bacterium]
MRALRIGLAVAAAAALFVIFSPTGAQEPGAKPVEAFPWDLVGPGSFSIEKDADGSTYMRSKGGMGLLWYTARTYRDFTVTLEYRVNKKNANSGIFVRFPKPYADGKGDPWIAVRKGYEVQIDDERDPKHRTGSIYSYWPAEEAPTKPVGQWNKMEITVIGRRYTCKVNDKQVLDYDEEKNPPQDGKRPLEGYFGLQNHDDGSVVDYRAIRVVEIE